MSDATKGLTFEEHQQLGAMLRKMNGDLADCLCACNGAFSLQSDIVKKGQKTMGALRDLRMALYGKLTDTFPDRDESELGSLYFDDTDG